MKVYDTSKGRMIDTDKCIWCDDSGYQIRGEGTGNICEFCDKGKEKLEEIKENI